MEQLLGPMRSVRSYHVTEAVRPATTSYLVSLFRVMRGCSTLTWLGLVALKWCKNRTHLQVLYTLPPLPSGQKSGFPIGYVFAARNLDTSHGIEKNG